ncbi:hypothetical protein ABTE32_23005, partial [Acinetobacter baumannii]
TLTWTMWPVCYVRLLRCGSCCSTVTTHIVNDGLIIITLARQALALLVSASGTAAADITT